MSGPSSELSRKVSLGAADSRKIVQSGLLTGHALARSPGSATVSTTLRKRFDQDVADTAHVPNHDISANSSRLDRSSVSGFRQIAYTTSALTSRRTGSSSRSDSLVRLICMATCATSVSRWWTW
jgi:hypothetical protein